jgi:hypothetical protein
MGPWTNHCAGALALLNLRGPGQLNNVMGLHLIHLLRIQVVSNVRSSNSNIKLT